MGKLAALLLAGTGLAGCVTLWHGEWGPAKFTFRFKDAASGNPIPPDAVEVKVSGTGYPTPDLRRRGQDFDLQFEPTSTAGTSGPLRKWGDVRIVFTLQAKGYSPRKLTYPDDFDVINYNTSEKIDWKPKVEFHGRTLFLEKE